MKAANQLKVILCYLLNRHLYYRARILQNIRKVKVSVDRMNMVANSMPETIENRAFKVEKVETVAESAWYAALEHAYELRIMLIEKYHNDGPFSQATEVMKLSVASMKESLVKVKESRRSLAAQIEDLKSRQPKKSTH